MPDGQSRIPVFLKDYSAPAFTVDTVELNFDLDPEATIVRARLSLTRQAPGPLVLDGRALELRQVALGSKPNKVVDIFCI
jgi:aminopeptidase N